MIKNGATRRTMIKNESSLLIMNSTRFIVTVIICVFVPSTYCGYR